ncbi:hypothetical protein Cmtc_49840 [Cupriavidus sp. TKC]|nr:hypothetical protein Cmtc_49840 [Cupriavidus sp. TKC]
MFEQERLDFSEERIVARNIGDTHTRQFGADRACEGIDLHDFIPWALWIEGGHARSRGAGNPETPARRLEMIVANRDACCLTHRAMTWRTMPIARARRPRTARNETKTVGF